MGSGFRFEMSGNFEDEVKKIARDAMKEAADDTQKLFDSLLRRYRGRPVSEIKAVLRREWSRRDGTMSERELTDYATLISEGTRIQVRVK